MRRGLGLRHLTVLPFLKAAPVRAMATTLPTHHDPHKTEQDKLLFTPGPLTTSYTVKRAAMRDLGSRDAAFMRVVQEVCSGLLSVAGVSDAEFTTVPLQGSGTYGVEAVLASVVPRKGNAHLAILANGAYGRRMGQIAKANAIPHTLLDKPETFIYSDPAETAKEVSECKPTHIAIVHSETTSGAINNIEAYAKYWKSQGCVVIVDAMSSFGAYPVDMTNIDFLVSSSNKCVEGIPGFSYAIARKDALKAAKGNATTLSLDLYAQREGLDKNGQFRFTPPTHALLAFHQALAELNQEGGVKARAARYAENQRVLHAAMTKMGFKLFLKPEEQGYIISSYRYPTDPNWNFEKFYAMLNDRGFVIYPGKVSDADCFRIGHIGRLFPTGESRVSSFSSP